MEPKSEDQMRRRLVEIADELRSVPDDGFGAKHELNVERDALRKQLTESGDGRSSETLKRWADRAGHKGSHAVDDDVEAAKAAIVSPGESGGVTT